MLRRLLSISTTAIQGAVTFVTLWCIYMVFAVSDGGEADLIHWAGLFIVQPLIAIVVSAATILACWLIGLPIRLNAQLNLWWRNMPMIPICGVVAGIIFLLLSFNGNFVETTTVTFDAEEVTKEIPNTTMILVGWLLVAFSMLHFYPAALFGMFRRVS